MREIFIVKFHCVLVECLTECDVVSNGVFRCTWCCDVGAGVTCSGVVRCGVVINMYVGVGVLVGILGVR